MKVWTNGQDGKTGEPGHGCSQKTWTNRHSRKEIRDQLVTKVQKDLVFQVHLEQEATQEKMVYQGRTGPLAIWSSREEVYLEVQDQGIQGMPGPSGKGWYGWKRWRGWITGTTWNDGNGNEGPRGFPGERAAGLLAGRTAWSKR